MGLPFVHECNKLVPYQATGLSATHPSPSASQKHTSKITSYGPNTSKSDIPSWISPKSDYHHTPNTFGLCHGCKHGVRKQGHTGAAKVSADAVPPAMANSGLLQVTKSIIKIKHKSFCTAMENQWSASGSFTNRGNEGVPWNGSDFNQ